MLRKPCRAATSSSRATASGGPRGVVFSSFLSVRGIANPSSHECRSHPERCAPARRFFFFFFRGQEENAIDLIRGAPQQRKIVDERLADPVAHASIRHLPSRAEAYTYRQFALSAAKTRPCGNCRRQCGVTASKCASSRAAQSLKTRSHADKKRLPRGDRSVSVSSVTSASEYRNQPAQRVRSVSRRCCHSRGHTRAPAPVQTRVIRRHRIEFAR